MIKHKKLEEEITFKERKNVLQPLVDFLDNSSMVEDYLEELKEEYFDAFIELDEAIISFKKLVEIVKS